MPHKIEFYFHTLYYSNGNGRLKFFKIFTVRQHATKRSPQFMPYSAPLYIARYTLPKLLATPGRNITHTLPLIKLAFASLSIYKHFFVSFSKDVLFRLVYMECGSWAIVVAAL